MDSATDVVKTSASSNADSFFKTVFNFDEDGKAEMMNILQYLVLAILPCIIILKAVGAIIPEEDDSKGSIEILAEISWSTSALILLMYFSDKAIRYVPTYSGIANVACIMPLGHINYDASIYDNYLDNADQARC